jgi:hypothetical protein
MQSFYMLEQVACIVTTGRQRVDIVPYIIFGGGRETEVVSPPVIWPCVWYCAHMQYNDGSHSSLDTWQGKVCFALPCVQEAEG